MEAPDDESIGDDTVVYRAYARKLDEDGRVQSLDFCQRPNETSLSIARLPEKALGDLDVRGYVGLTAGSIRAIRDGDKRLGIRQKEGDDPDLLEVCGISEESAVAYSISLAACPMEKPVEQPEHRKRIRALRALARARSERF
jgi:hypothetical protein